MLCRWWGVRCLLHARVWPRASGSVADTGLPQHGMAFRLRCRHVLLLLLHRLRPRSHQSDRKWSDRGGNRWHCPGIPDAEGVARRAGPQGHRLRLSLHIGAARDPGHSEVAVRRERDNEDSVEGQHCGHHLPLPWVRVLRLCGIRRHHPGEPPHRLRLLRALLAHRPRQLRRRPTPPRWLPGVQLAGVRSGGAAVGSRRILLPRGGAAARMEAREPVQAVLPHGVRCGDHDSGGVVPLLQPGGRADRRFQLLAQGHSLPRRDVHRAGQDGVEMYVVQAKMAPWTGRWLAIRAFSASCLLVCIFASVSSAVGVFGSKRS